MFESKQYLGRETARKDMNLQPLKIMVPPERQQKRCRRRLQIGNKNTDRGVPVFEVFNSPILSDADEWDRSRCTDHP